MDSTARVTSQIDIGTPSARRLAWLLRWLALCGLLLVVATWRLWTPQEAFPQVPFVAALRGTLDWLDWILLAELIVGLVGMLILPTSRRFIIGDLSSRGERDLRRRLLDGSAVLMVLSLTLLVLLDQHRLQPWAYQFAVVAIVLAFAPPVQAVSLLRVLAVGIYFWSAVSKLDYSFLHGVGPDLLRGLLAAVQLDAGLISGDATVLAVWVFPLGELAIVVLLAVRRTRPIGLTGAIAMHVLLLAALGPWGLDHEPGVLIWNVYFIGQDVLLFAGSASRGRLPRDPFMRLRESIDLTRGLTPTARLAHLVVFAAVWLPILEPFGLLDHWPAWAVYAPGAERVTLLIDADAADRLPPELQRHLGPADFATGARVLRTDLWSLEALGAPIYPQGRFRAGVALAVVEQYGLGDGARLVVESRADRWTGRRSRSEVVGKEAIREFAESFPLNALPREP